MQTGANTFKANTLLTEPSLMPLDYLFLNIVLGAPRFHYSKQWEGHERAVNEVSDYFVLFLLGPCAFNS